jgi:hypothetical protein
MGFRVVSWVGMLLAAALVFGDGAMLLFPRAMNVEHRNMVPRGNEASRAATPVEHVPRGRARIYGGCLVLLGALALGLSVQKVRRGEVNRKSASGR